MMNKRTDAAECTPTSIEYRYVFVAELTWKFRLNVDSALESKYKEVCFKKWKAMTTEDGGYANVVAGQESVEDVPAQDTTDQAQVIAESMIELDVRLLGGY